MSNRSSVLRRWTPIILLLAVAVLALAGCTGNKRSGQGTAQLTVGFLGPLSGDAASFGASQKNGIALAVEEINAAGGVLGQPVKVVYEDTQLDQNKAIAGFNKLVDSDKCQVVLGESSSANTSAIGPLADRKSVVLLSPIASSAKLTTSGFKLFRVSPSDAFQARIGAQYALQTGWRTATVLYTNDEWGTGLKDAFTEAFTAAGGTVLDSAGVEPKSQDFRPQLTKIKAAAPAVVYIPLHPDEAAVALKQSSQLGLKSQFLGADSFSEATIVKIAGAAANGVVYTVPSPGFGTTYETFAKKYKAKYSEDPNYNAAAGYDSMRVVAEAATKAGKLDTAALRQALSETKGFEGASGTIIFDANGDVTSKAFDIKKLKGGKPVDVKQRISAAG